jgi:benzoate membrane transport protein
MPLAPLLAGLTAAVVGCGGSIAIVLAAAEALGATAGQTASWMTALCFAMAATTAILSIWHRLPIITAWSTPGAALIAASGGGIGMEAGVGAFLVAAALIVLAALIAPLTRLIEQIPTPIAAAMLAGVLLRLVMAPFEAIPSAPWLIVPMVALFLLARMIAPSLAVIIVLVAGAGLATALGLMKPLPPLAFAHLEWVTPAFDIGGVLGLGVPLFLVTMASQNLAGFAVLRASGYPEVPSQSILGVTGIASLVTAPLGAHTSNLAAISAAICTGPDAHPDPLKRWWAGPSYALSYLAFGLVGPSLVGLFATLPSALVKTVAGMALAGPMIAALGAAFGGSGDRFAPGMTFAVTASGMAMFGVGAAFWGLMAGLITHGLQAARR